MSRMSLLFDFFKKRPEAVFDLVKIKWYFENNVSKQAYQVLSAQTCTDLDFDSFFIRVNGTSSCVGQQYLYDRLRRIPYESEMTGNEELITYLKNNTKSALRCRKWLSRLAHDDAYYICSLFHDTHPTPSPFMKHLLYLLQYMPLLFTLIFIISPKGLWLFFISVFFFVNAILHYHNKKIQFVYLYSIPQLLKLVSIAKKLSTEKPFNQTHSDIDNHLKSLAPLVRRLARFKFDVKFESDLAAFVFLIKELVSIFFLSEPNSLFRSFRLIDANRTGIEAVFAYVGHIDMVMSVALLQEIFPCYCKPEWTDDGLRMTDVYHPLIEQCIPNTLNTFGKSVLLTGSNMSGKTTFIRTVALNMLCAQTLDMCFAKNFSGQRMRIHSAINLSDNILESESFYMKEVRTVKEILEKSQEFEHNLFLLDEIFKGTNTPERIAASKAVLSVLAGNGNLVFASTHDIELADLLSGEYNLYHFCEQIKQNRLHFDYLLKQGTILTVSIKLCIYRMKRNILLKHLKENGCTLKFLILKP